jgi:hypothetical protein
MRLWSDAATEDLIADSLLRSAEVAILDWLHRHAARLVLPLDTLSPRFVVLQDQLAIGGRASELTITAFDQCGMRSWQMVESGHRSGLSPEIDRMVARQARSLSPLGLDVLNALPAGGASVFPQASRGQDLVLGELMATHNPPRAGATPVINVNTAPMSLIAAVYDDRAQGGLEAVAAARAAGRVASPGALAAPRGASSDGKPLPVAMSTAWAFRVDCDVGRARRSWWCVYVDTGSNWERVQLLGIDE